MAELTKFSISSTHRTSLFTLYPGQFLFMERTMDYEKDFTQTVAYCHGWYIFSRAPFENNTGSVQACIEGKWIELSEHSKVFIPPFSVVEWKFTGKLTFHMYYCFKPLPVDFPKEPLLIENDEPTQRENLESQTKRLLSMCKLMPLGRTSHPCPISRKLKNYIDLNFEWDELDIVDCAKELGINRTSMSKRFKKSFGVSPVKYRNLLRVMRAQELMLMEQVGATETAVACGFEDFSTFFRNFKEHTTVKPSAYLKDKSDVK